jgi:hypothetical protein
MAALLMTGCGSAKAPPPPARVALWTISDGSGVRGWLLGTVHALPPGTVWRRAAIDQALSAADRLVLEIGEPLDSTVAGEALGRLAFTQGLPAPSARIAPEEARALGCHLRFDPRVIRPPVPVDAGQSCVMINGIAGDGMAIARNRDDVRRVFLAVEIDDKAGQIAKDAGEFEMGTQSLPQFRHADVDGDVFLQNRRGDAKVQVVWHAVGRVVGDEEEGAGRGSGNVLPRLIGHQFLLPATRRNVTIGQHREQGLR